MKARTICLALASAALLASGTTHAAVRDRTPPSVRFTTVESQFFQMPTQNPLLEHAVRGTATDALTGIREVRVTYTPCKVPNGACDGTGTVNEAQSHVNSNIIFGSMEVRCTNSTRRSCTWAISSPPAPGYYLVRAWAYDRAGVRSAARGLHIYVV